MSEESWKFVAHTDANIFIQENAPENVCNMTAIFSQPQCVELCYTCLNYVNYSTGEDLYHFVFSFSLVAVVRARSWVRLWTMVVCCWRPQLSGWLWSLCSLGWKRVGGSGIITGRLWQNGGHIAEDIFKLILLYEHCYILSQISLKFVPLGTNKDHQQCSLSLVVKSATTDCPLAGCKTSLQIMQYIRKIIIWKVSLFRIYIMKNMPCEYNKTDHNLLLHAFTIVLVHIMAKFYCFSSSFVPDLEANFVVPELTTRDKEHCWWSLLTINHDWFRWWSGVGQVTGGNVNQWRPCSLTQLCVIRPQCIIGHWCQCEKTALCKVVSHWLSRHLLALGYINDIRYQEYMQYWVNILITKRAQWLYVCGLESSVKYLR